MKKLNSLLIILGCILSIVPIYAFIGLVYIDYKYEYIINNKEIFEIYNSQVFASIFNSNLNRDLFIISLGVLGSIFFLITIINSSKYKPFKITLFITIVLFTCLNLMRML